MGDAPSGHDAAVPAVSQEAALLAADAAIPVRNPDESYQRQNAVPAENGLNYISYQKSYKNLRVVGSDAVVVANSAGQIVSTNEANPAPVSVDTTPVVSKEQALAKAKSQLDKATDSMEPKLVVSTLGGQPALAWEVRVRGTEQNKPSNQFVYVDAKNGSINHSYDLVKAADGNGYYNGNIQIDTSGSGSSYSLNDPNRTGLKCGNISNKTALTKSTDSWGSGAARNVETACVDAMFAVQQEWNMVKEWFGRNGIDGNGRGFPAWVNLQDANAYWTGDHTEFGYNGSKAKDMTSIDVVGHEFGHAIFQYSGSGQGSGTEANGMNESTGDIFGALVEHYVNGKDKPDYDVGELVDFFGNGKNLRFMYKPSLDGGSPDCYTTSWPSDEHLVAGPQNHWFYLLAEGSKPTNGQPESPTCNNSSITGLGIQTAGKIFYNALQQKTSSWNYAALRKAALTAAKNLFPNSCGEFNTTKAAFDAVSVKAVSGEATCTGPTSTSQPPTSTTTTTPPTTTTSQPPATEAPDISVDAVKGHLAELQKAADGNGGNRYSGSGGFKASVDYIEGKLKAAGYTVTRQNCTSCSSGSQNLIADWPGGDTGNTLMLGAHLDSVSAGPGINDNGSGSATILENALTVAAKKPSLSRHLRFAWWSDEEQGLVGSKFYVNSLSSADKAKIKSYLNFDMTGSPNGGYFINNITTDLGKAFKAYFDKIGVAAEENTEGAGRSDDYSFQNAGIASSGFAAGASARKTAAQAQKWGGTSGQAYDSCYHSACDKNPGNINGTILDRGADSVASAIWALAVSGGTTTTPPTTTTTTPPTSTTTTTPPTTTTTTPSGNFTVAVNPSGGTVAVGGQISAKVSVGSGARGPVRLTAINDELDAYFWFSPSTVSSGGSSTLTLWTWYGTAPGSYPVTIQATDGYSTTTTTYTLVVQ
ncbi:M28 family peptidase [Pseudonocardiaceae bacterium YIM PH 21723]|nr:M28 family peptidase [Pseudonocardiaceae bacterium YIM PH 21723]